MPSKARRRLQPPAVLPEQALAAVLEAVSAVPSAGFAIGTAATAAMAVAAQRLTRAEQPGRTR